MVDCVSGIRLGKMYCEGGRGTGLEKGVGWERKGREGKVHVPIPGLT